MVENGVPSAPTEGLPEGFLAPGQMLGDRYQIRSQLGRGGMGEVWRAFDLKLRVEVALKALLPKLTRDERRRETLRREVRAAREVLSPNVCRIFDLIEIDGRELVSMEYVDGGTLLEVLQERGALDLKEAQDIASQFLAGLEAIHRVGLVHRDVKPENIMLTRAGRVVVMDFGLARQDTEGGGSVSGTPAYMAPEHAAGQTLDARADVYSAGVVLAEMVSPEGIKSFESRQRVWEGVRSEPAKLPDSPWAPVLKKAVAKDRAGRYNSAHTLTRALEDVTLRVEGAEDLHPYPGLASFTEEDAEYFFGREAEVEQMWRKLEGPARMLSLVGPSGAGKSSFLRAGLLPARHDGWAFLVVPPGEQPFVNLGGAITRALASDLEALEKMVRFSKPEVAIEVFQRWRRRHEHAILVVDQFEELFTLNPGNTQASFAGLLGRLPLEADVHVLVSMRDDFLGHCHEQSPLTPMFSDLTFLGTPAGGALRRAVVRPATKCGYRFEDDALVEEMFAEVEGERGTLPLLAFALARLWEQRDRETGLLTRQAYHDIGGVGGALARHAEATIDRIGSDHIAIVREIFRNLVTAEGTRAVREWGELLSVFDTGGVSRAGINPAPTKEIVAAEEVLRELIDARLLTSYEVREEDREPIRRVEIIHESLLANWPRLVRWQTQDADAAQLRDQLRQAARTWDEQGRTDDTLWTGSAYREFALWRERYPGGFTDIEEDFAQAMTAHAKRRKRRRRAAVAAAFVVLLAVLGVVGVSRQQAIAEAKRAEAAKLLALAQLQLEKDPTEAQAYATTSLEVSDTLDARFFVMKALWEAPPALVLDWGNTSVRVPTFSPDGRWLATAGHHDEALVWPETGGDPVRLPGHVTSPNGPSIGRWCSSEFVVTGNPHGVEERVRVWSIPDGRLLRTIDFGAPTWWQVGETHLFAEVDETEADSDHTILQLRSWQLPDGEGEDLGRVDVTALGRRSSCFDPTGKGWIYAKGNTLYYRPLPTHDGLSDLVLGRHEHEARVLIPDVADPDRVWSADQSTLERRCWSLSNPDPEPMAVIPPPPDREERYAVRYGTGRWWCRRAGWAVANAGNKAPLLWDLGGLSGARPLQLKRNADWYMSNMHIHPEGKWLAASVNIWRQLVFWPLVNPYPSVVEGYVSPLRPVAFSPNGDWLATDWDDNSLRIWPLPSSGQQRPLAPELNGILFRLIFDATGERLLRVGFGHNISIMPLDGGPSKRLEGFSSAQVLFSAAFSPSERLVAAGSGFGTTEKKVLRVWDLETGEVRVFDLEPAGLETAETSDSEASLQGYEYGINDLVFADESTLYTSGWDGVRKWDLGTGLSQVVVPRRPDTMTSMAMSADRTTMVTQTVHYGSSDSKSALDLYDLVADTVRPLDHFGDRFETIHQFAIDPEGKILVTGDEKGIVRVGRIDGGEPHLLLGHDGKVTSVAVSPDLQWIASAGQDETLRLWPMPDLSKKPLHTLPHDELIAKLHSLTNLRVVRDEESSTGWKVEIGPFPGWAEVPEW